MRIAEIKKCYGIIKYEFCRNWTRSFGVKRAKAIKSSKNAKLVCIFDPNKNNAQKAEKELNVPCKSFQKILKNKEIDVICICTPNKFHKELILSH